MRFFLPPPRPPCCECENPTEREGYQEEKVAPERNYDESKQAAAAAAEAAAAAAAGQKAEQKGKRAEAEERSGAPASANAKRPGDSLRSVRIKRLALVNEEKPRAGAYIGEEGAGPLNTTTRRVVVPST